jgi:hypothetical protein
LGINAIVWWNSLYIDAAVKRLEAGGLGVGPEIRARLSPLLFEHINLIGTYSFARPDLGPTGVRPLRARPARSGRGPLLSAADLVALGDQS